MTGELSQQLKHLHMTAFAEGEGYFDYFFANVASENNIFYIERDKLAVSALYVLERTIVRDGRRIPVAFISGVATLPEYRNKGLAHECISMALRTLNGRGLPFVLLCPFNEEFYAKLGFAAVSKIAEYSSAEPLLKRPITPKDGEFVGRIHERLGGSFYLERSECDFKHRIAELAADGGHGSFLCDGDRRVGYLFGGADDFELAAEGREAAVPFGMARICNLYAALEALLERGADYSFSLSVTDKIIISNNAEVRITNDGGIPRVFKRRRGAIPQRHIDVAYLTAYLFGATEPQIGLAAAFTKERFFMTDRY